MNSILRILVLVTTFGAVVLSCNKVNKDTKVQVIATHDSEEIVRKSTMQDTLSIKLISNNDFDINQFINNANALLTTIKGKSIRLTFNIDSINVDANKYSPLRALLPSMAMIKKYYFDPGKGNRELRFWLVDATYSDKTTIEKAFKELNRLSGKVNGNNDFTPGLTYSNDYVIRTDDKIFWLNSLCPFEFKNHQKLSKLLLKSLNINNVKDSIHCKCGQPVCGLQYP